MSQVPAFRSIGEHVTFQTALQEYSESATETARIVDEANPLYALCSEADSLARHAVIAIVDAYCARNTVQRIGAFLPGGAT